jgi:hypothetical protein
MSGNHSGDPRDNVIGKILGITYDIVDGISSRKLPDHITQPLFELHTAGTSVAYMCGIVGGVVVKKVGLPIWVVPPVSFGISWWVCERLFPVTHEFYDSGSLYHRIYDMNSVLAGLVAYKLVK